MHMYGSVCVVVCMYYGVRFVVIAAGSMCTYVVRACRYVYVCGSVRGVFPKLIDRYVYVGAALSGCTWRMLVRMYDYCHRRRIAITNSRSSINDVHVASCMHTRMDKRSFIFISHWLPAKATNIAGIVPLTHARLVTCCACQVGPSKPNLGRKIAPKLGQVGSKTAPK